MNDIKKQIIKEWMINMNKKSLNINEILDLLEENEQLKDILHRERERDYHRQDIRNEIDFFNEEKKDEFQIIIDDETIEKITDYYEDRLDNSEDWHFILKDSLKSFNID